MSIEKEREAYNTWHFNNWKLTFAVTYSIEDAKELYDRVYSHDIQNIKREREFMVWQAAKASAVPDGYCIVPKEPSIAMVTAYYSTPKPTAGRCYKAMIEAAQED